MGETIGRKERRARKERRCDICNSAILPGEQYIRIAFVDDGRIHVWNEHIHCETLVERYCMTTHEDEFNAEDIECWAQDEICSECDQRDDNCDYMALTCPRVLKGLLPPVLLSHEDVRKRL